MNLLKITKNILKKENIFLIIFFCFLFVLCPIRSFSQKADKVKKIKTVATIKEKPGKNKTEVDLTGNKSEANKSLVSEKTGIPEKEYTENDFKPKVEEESYAWMVIKTLFILGLLIGGFYYFFRFVSKKAGGIVLGQDVLQTLSILPLGQNKYLQVIDLAGKILVLGVTENSINLIKEITEKEEIDRIRLLSSKSSGDSQKSFQEQIMNQVGKFVDKVSQVREKNKVFSEENEKIESGVDLTFLKNQKNRLKNLNRLGND